MLPRFFIDRPIFAWVIAIFIVLAGMVAITQLPITQYPKIAPPTVTVNVVYPGASAQQIEESVLELIEREINGTPKMIYMEAGALANGTGTLTISFEPGTDGDQAQIEVQNRVAQALPRLSRMHRRVADHVLAHPLQVATLPIDELAAAVGVSVATAGWVGCAAVSCACRVTASV